MNSHITSLVSQIESDPGCSEEMKCALGKFKNVAEERSYKMVRDTHAKVRALCGTLDADLSAIEYLCSRCKETDKKLMDMLVDKKSDVETSLLIHKKTLSDLTKELSNKRNKCTYTHSVFYI